jgi:hypothetical protein
MKPNPFFRQKQYITFSVEKRDYFCIVRKMPKEKNRPTGENSPNLVTLLHANRIFLSCIYLHMYVHTALMNAALFRQTHVC